MKRRTTAVVAVLVGLCVVAAGCSSGRGSTLSSSLSRSSVAAHRATTTTTGHVASTTASTTTTTNPLAGSTGTTGNTGHAAPAGNTGNTGGPLPCPAAPTAALTSSQSSPAPVTGNSGEVKLTVTGNGTFTNPSAYPVLMNVDLVVSSQSAPNGPTQTTDVPVSASDPNEGGLLAGPITINWQQDTTVNEYTGGQPSVSVAAGWTYSTEGLVQCDQ